MRSAPERDGTTAAQQALPSPQGGKQVPTTGISHLNAECQRIARSDKDFLSSQCKEIEENNRMGKTRDLFKKIRDTKGTFHAKMGIIRDMGLTEAEETKKRWQEYTEELYKKAKKVLMTQITTMV